MDDGFRVDVSHVDGVATVTAQGEIDMSTAALLEHVLDQFEPCERVVVDLAGVDFMDSTGLAVLVVQSALRLNAGGSLHVSRASMPVRHLLDVAGLDDMIETKVTGQSAPCNLARFSVTR